MAKKRKASGRKPEPSGPRDVDVKDARLTVRTYEDVANSEDEYYMEKDRIDFDDEPRSKRLRRAEREDEFLEASDEEIFEDELGSDEEEDEAPSRSKKAAKKGKKQDISDEEEEERGGNEEEGDAGWWGSSKQDYYNADQIETEADALEEEAEARRIQAKKLSKMQEADFTFDEGEWLAPTKDTEGDKDTVTEVLGDAEVPADMGPEERYKLLQTRYPEFDYLVDEFRELQPLLTTTQKEAEGKPAKSLEVIKYWVLGSYVASLASYFAILTSPARDGDGSRKTISPAELRDHEIMETLMECRETWLRVKNLKTTKTAKQSNGMLSPPEEEDEDVSMDEMEEYLASIAKKSEGKKLSKNEIKAAQKKAAAKAKKAQAVQQSLADLDALLDKTKTSSSKTARTRKSAAEDDDEDNDNRSDFGEEDEMDERAAANKAQRKKSLRFYTSQIVQKASRRADAGRDAGGDMDIPYRERLKDRVARLNAEAERRGKKSGKGAELGGDDSDGDQDAVAREVRGGEDEYYDMVAQKASQKKADKAARFEALAAAGKGQVVETEEIGPDGKRKITYQIQKNKGLAPKRKKDVRNPRVKKRKKFEEKKKRLKSVRAVYQGGEGRGGYQGELSGIKTGLVKSTKL
ncbi:Sas10 C-terminal domain-containing protein [Diplogelasinospora grovesii]|uniref:Sas10 C-terminal domain-containing protein n=1 Tax=Diplogelasinospora grovesii TaxID=303347 RepID=A0AAN6S8P5_9PEZI|nr:Sas10 C-terminal domain-containing protein [Diplogelasinospora grovesii]